jgi:hypothetical protein
MSNQETLEEIKELKRELAEYKKIIEDMSVPIIPSIIPETVLLPITGKIYPELFENIITKISGFAYSSDISTIIIDFSAIGKNEIGEIEVFGGYIVKLASTLKLLGVEVLYTGFTPEVTPEIVKSEFYYVNQLKTFQSFKTALQYLMNEKGIKFVMENEPIL